MLHEHIIHHKNHTLFPVYEDFAPTATDRFAGLNTRHAERLVKWHKVRAHWVVRASGVGMCRRGEERTESLRMGAMLAVTTPGTAAFCPATGGSRYSYGPAQVPLLPADPPT